MDQREAEATALAAVNRGRDPHDALQVVPGSPTRAPYGWTMFVQSRRYLESGAERFMLVGVGPVVVMNDGTVHLLGSAHSPEEELRAFEAAHGLEQGRATGGPGPEGGGPPVWVGAQQRDGLPVLAVTPEGVVSALLPPGELERLLRHGPDVLEDLRRTTVPVADIDRIRTGEGAALRIERRGDVNVTVTFGTPDDRDRALHGLRALLAPQAPVVPMRRPARRFVELAGLALLSLLLGFGLPWMVETGQIERTHWLAATVYNRLGPTAFRVLGGILALGCLAGLLALAVNNPASVGYRVRRPGLERQR